MEIRRIGIDLGKTVFHFAGVNARGEVVVRKKVSRTLLPRFTSDLHDYLIVMEACGRSHFPGGRYPARNTIEEHILDTPHHCGSQNENGISATALLVNLQAVCYI
jgi:hypothetical protein